MSELRGWAAEDRGQSFVEVALCLPILLLIVIGIVDIGRVYAYKVATTNAAREAAIFGARFPQATGATICQRAIEELASGSGGGPCLADPSDPDPLDPKTWRSTVGSIKVECTRAGGPCGNAPTPRLFQGLGAGGAEVSVTVTNRVSLLSTYLVSRAFQFNPVEVGGTATFIGLGE